MSEWDPATDAEVAMRDALRTDDQESYFRILAGVDLLLPVSADALAGLAPLGWGTWSTGGRTHVLAFTSQESLRACLSDYTGASRRVPYAELANTWPNLEWWLAVNPGLPIEGYLPAWFVAQLARGDLRLPTRGPGRDALSSTSKIQEIGAAALAASRGADAPGGPTYDPATSGPAPAVPAGMGPGTPMPGQQPGLSPVAPSVAPIPPVGTPSSPMSAPPAPGGLSSPMSAPPSSGGLSSPGGSSSPMSAPPSSGGPSSPGGSTPPMSAPFPPGAPGAPGGAPPQTGPGGLPVRPPGPPAPSGLPTRGPAPGPAGPTGLPMRPPAPAAAEPPAPYQPPAIPRDFISGPGPAPSSGMPGPAPSSGMPGPAPSSGMPGPVQSSGMSGPMPSSGGPAPGRAGAVPGSGTATPGWDKPGMPFDPEQDPRGPLQDLKAPLPVRTPMANTPPIPEHVTPYDPAETPFAPNWSTPPSSGAPAPAAREALPRRQPGQSAGAGQMSSMPGFVPANSANTAPPSPPPHAPTSSPGFGGPSGPAPTSSPGYGAAASAGAPSFPQGPASPQAMAAHGGQAPAGPGGQALAGPGGQALAGPGGQALAGPGGQALAGPGGQGAAGPGSPLPRRQVPPPSERPTSMAAAAQALGATRQPPVDTSSQDRPGPPGMSDRFGPSGPAPSIQPPATEPPVRSALAPPVIPGVPGMDRGGASAYQPHPYGGPGSSTSGSPAPSYGDPNSPTSGGPGPSYGAPSYGSPGSTPALGAAPAAYSPPAPPIPGMPPQGSPAAAYTSQTLGANAFVTQALPIAPGGYQAAASSGLGVAGSATGSRQPADTAAQRAQAADFVPANDVERDLRDAADTGNTDAFLSTLLLANVLVPVADHSRPGSSPGESGFAFLPEDVEGERFLIVFTSKDRLSEHFGEPTRTVGVRFYELIRNWPDPAWSFAVNPGTPVGAKYPGAQIVALANWATEAGLGAEPADGPIEAAVAPVPAPEPASDEAQQATVMQKTISAEQVDYYLDRGYDRVAGFVHRASEVEHLRTPGELFEALGLYYDSSPFQPDAKEAFVLRWPAFRPSLYRIPYGGQNEQALRAMDGWVIERAPFRGNGFAPGEGKDVIAEFKVDSVRLPHGAQLWRLDADGDDRMLAIFDADGPLWRRVGEQ